MRHLIARFLAWTIGTTAQPRGRHRNRPAPCPAPPAPPASRPSPDLIPAPAPVRMDDPRDPRAYAMVRAPFATWERDQQQRYDDRQRLGVAVLLDIAQPQPRPQPGEWDELAGLVRQALAMGVGT